MLFNSLGFLFVFLPIVLWVALRLKGQRLLQWVTVVSLLFYSFAGHSWFLLPMLFTTVLDFLLAPQIASRTGWKRKALLIVSICGNLGLLFYFKYSKLLAGTLQSSLVELGMFSSTAKSWANVFEVVLPAGISFYTFQTLSYIIDVYRGVAKPEKNFWLFTSFVSFFPHLVAGPLTRHNQLIPSLENIAEHGPRPAWRAGFFLFTLGLAKKVLIADRIANLIDPIILVPEQMSGLTAWLSLLGYTLQIYFDFSGYSDMAIGLGRLFGIELPQNFNSPYQATDPSDFWKRWHITLSSWLRDYLYISLGGNRCSAARQNFNLMATMVLGGLWHGASWTFAIWGLYHGMLLIIYHRVQSRWDCLALWIRRLLTFVLVMIGWLFFRAESFHQARIWIRHLIAWNVPLYRQQEMLTSSTMMLISYLAVGLLIALFLRNASSYSRFERLGSWSEVALGGVAVVAILFMNYSSKFLYFQF